MPVRFRSTALMPFKDPERQREYQREWVRSRRDSFFSDKACERCGSTNRLELDHRDPKTKVSHNIWSWSDDRRSKEIAKCQVLCNSCHQDKSNKEKVYGTNHGNCKLDEKQIIEIRLLHSLGEQRKNIAAKFGISPPNVYEIVHSRTWKHMASSSSGEDARLSIL